MSKGNYHLVDTTRMNAAQKMGFNNDAKRAGKYSAVDTSQMNDAQLMSFNRDA